MLIILCYLISYFADTLLEDAERIKTEQTKRIETLERDLKAANSKPAGTSAKNEPLTRAVETVQPASVMKRKQTIICQTFSDDNYKVAVSKDKRSVKGNGDGLGYCFLNHEKIKKNQTLKWSLRVPKSNWGLGMVFILELIIFDFLKITFQRNWYICQSTNGRME